MNGESPLTKGTQQGWGLLHLWPAAGCGRVPVKPVHALRLGVQSSTPEGVSGAFQMPREEILKSWEICVLIV